MIKIRETKGAEQWYRQKRKLPVLNLTTVS